MAKKDLQEKLEKITGVAPDDSLTVKQLEEALKEVEAIEGEAEEQSEKIVKIVKKGRKVIGGLY